MGENLMKHAEDLADSNDLTASKSAVDSANKKKQEIEDLKEKHTFMSEADKVCGVCGVRCNPNMESDFQAHLDGRLHEGYTHIRAKVRELREKCKNAADLIDANEKDRDRRRTDEHKPKTDEHKSKTNGEDKSR